ncbi:GMC family oxidoreductase [Peristeroidobacter soli]|uniref:GMC family oxidoreductase n=1 Tax=Peristeroidobacter soli TaxID=2497877 RepID=UPI00101D0869|nr:GMC family oxidoreductase N-terminal domain-containing protein [Peristeroidobacter soli]
MAKRIHFDDVIIGGGSAGCAAAYGLATRTSRKVLLIEAGKDTRTLHTRVPGFVREAVSRFDWGYVSEPDGSREGRRESWARGRILGGSSSVNGMMFVRGAPSDYDRWAGLQNPGWSWRDVAPIFAALESSDRPGTGRGHAGPLGVRTVTRPHPLTRAFLEASAGAGYPINDDYNDGDQTGFGLAQLSQRRGMRCSSADAFIAEIRGRQNFTLWSECEVQRLVFDERGTATHALCKRAGEDIGVSADRIILSAGAVGTPKLLLLSGVGDSDELKALDIPAMIHSPQVGRNLMEHPLVRLVFETSIGSRNPLGFGQSLRELAEFVLHREGLLAGAFEAAGFVKSDEGLTHPDLQYHFLPIGVQDAVTHAESVLKVPSFTIYANLSYPKGRGRLQLTSNDPNAAPRLFPDLLGGGEGDITALVNAIKIARRIVQAPAMRELVKQEVTPGPQIQTEAHLRDHVRRNTEIAYHIAGTCRMGSDAQAVVSPDLKLNGATNVWLADASIFPELISGNTNAACMMIGMKLAWALAGTRSASVAA